ncbi:four helix bundle protein [Carboxylicivirga taeanensis]|uniref:four helix bundle protein n=1 Tax=Carboxylicivirga taeanensis TaxID=1416875 RepID=UPI003F6DE6CB
MKTFRELLVWQKSMDFVTEAYNVTAGFPDDEKFGLTNQLRRASVSIPSNIAEGFGRKSDGDFSRFLSIALGSSFEVQTQLEIAKNVDL